MKHGAIALLVGLCFWFLLFGATGLFTSGFHLVDEHVQLEMAADLAAPDATLWGVVREWVTMDIGERRFRPLYYASRVVRSELFGVSWPAWAAYNAILAALTSAALFVFGRLIGLTTWLSLGLAAWSMLGRPSTIWWRLGTPETEGNALLALALMFVALAVVLPKCRVSGEWSACLCAVLASLTKEGMILYLPAIAAIRIWLPCWTGKATLKAALREAAPMVMAIGLVAGMELLVLAGAVGTAGTGYAGVDAGSIAPGRLWASVKAVDVVAAFWIPCAASAVAVSNRVFRSDRCCAPTALPLLGAWLAFLVAALPQMLLYSKSGWADHYYNPLVISCALLIMLSVDCLRRVHRWLYLLFGVLVLLQLNPRFKWTKQHAREYAADGTALQRLLDAAEACSHPGEPLLVVANPRVHYEEAYSLRTHLSLTRDRRHVYLATVGAAGARIFSGALKDKEEARAFLRPETLGQHYFHGDTLSTMTPAQREGLAVLLILSPESLQPPFLDGESDWFRYNRYRTADFETSGHRVRLMCRNR